MRRILIVDDNVEMARMIADDLHDHGYTAVPTSSGKQACALVKTETFDLVVTDLRMPDADGLQVLAASKEAVPQRPVIVMTAYSAIDTAVEAIRSGAYHYITKPFKNDELLLFIERAFAELDLRREARLLKEELKSSATLATLIAASPAMKPVLDIVERVSRSSVPVLLTGETGTGKSVVARAIHDAGERAGKPFVTVNCAALPENLLESELFGHVKGAFTGAQATRAGLFVDANGGTLFLDEIGEMEPGLQAKLLHVLERGAVRPVGSEREAAVDVRIIAATNRDLRKAAKEGRFREDLLFRLDVVTIELPALWKRRDDIVPLANKFLTDARRRHPSSSVEGFGADVVEAFQRARWPGNVRELKHVVERLVVLGRGRQATLADLPPSTTENDPTAMFAGDVIPIRRLQRLYAQWALAQVGGHKGRCAEKLGVDAKTLGKWLAESKELETAAADDKNGDDKDGDDKDGDDKNADDR